MLILFGWVIFSSASLFALAIGALFVLFSSEHIYNFITRSEKARIQKLSSTKLAGPLAILIPSMMLFFVQLLVRLLNESGNTL